MGGIPEVVVPDETGLLVDLEVKAGNLLTRDQFRRKFSRDLADAIKTVRLTDSARKFEATVRPVVQDHFSWTAIAQRTLDLYRSL